MMSPPPAAWLDLAAALDERGEFVAVHLEDDRTVARDARGSTCELRALDPVDIDDLISYLDARSEADYGPRGGGPASRIMPPGLSYSVMTPPTLDRSILVVRRWAAAASWRSAL